MRTPTASPGPARTLARVAPVAAAVVLVAIGLTGCRLEVRDPAASKSPAAAGSEAHTPGGAGETHTDAGSPASDRDELAARATITVPCMPDLDIDDHGAIVRVEGDCDSLTVSADAAIVVADAIGSLLVTGTGSTVYVTDVGRLQLDGDADVVSWQGKTPIVTDNGTSNTFGKEDR